MMLEIRMKVALLAGPLTISSWELAPWDDHYWSILDQWSQELFPMLTCLTCWNLLKSVEICWNLYFQNPISSSSTMFNQFSQFSQAPDESGSSEQWFHLLETAPGSPCWNPPRRHPNRSRPAMPILSQLKWSSQVECDIYIYMWYNIYTYILHIHIALHTKNIHIMIILYYYYVSTYRSKYSIWNRQPVVPLNSTGSCVWSQKAYRFDQILSCQDYALYSVLQYLQRTEANQA